MKKLLVLLIFASAPCFATVNQIEYLYGGGLPRSSVDVGNGSDREGERGPIWMVNFLHVAAPRFYLGVGGGQFRSGDRVSATFIPLTQTIIKSRMSSVFALARADLSGNPKVLTYAVGGIGWVRHSLSITSDSTKVVDDSQEAFGYTAGLGMDFLLSDRLFIGAEGRYQGCLRKSFQLTPEGAALTGRTSISTPFSVYVLGFKAGIKY